MKRLSLAIMFVCCTLAMAAQDAIRVNYQQPILHLLMAKTASATTKP